MPYRAEPSGPDKTKAITAVIAVYAVMIGALLLVRNDSPVRLGENEPIVLIDVNELPPPQPPPETEAGKAKEEEGAAGKKAEPTEIVAPKPQITVPAKPPVAAAPIAGTGSASTAGRATAGTGPGAGGSGTGRGGEDPAVVAALANRHACWVAIRQDCHRACSANSPRTEATAICC